MAGQRREDPIRGLERARFHAQRIGRRARCFEFVGQAAHQTGWIAIGQQCRHGPQRHRVLAKALDLEAQPNQRLAAFQQRRERPRGESHRDGREQALARDAAVEPLGAKPLVEHALVRGVLIDQQQDVLGLQEQVGGEELPQQPEVAEAQARHPGRRVRRRAGELR